MASRGTNAGKGKGTSRPGARTTPRATSSRASSPRATSSRTTSSRATSSRAAGSRGTGAAGRADKARPAASARAPRALREQGGKDSGSGLWRWGVIALAALVLVVLLAPTVRSYVAQRSDIAALERQVAQGEERVAQLEAEQERWRDPAYVEQQARERLKFVRPGEVSYTVIGADEVTEAEIATGMVSEDRPWYDRVWGSVGQADLSQPDLGSEPGR